MGHKKHKKDKESKKRKHRERDRSKSGSEDDVVIVDKEKHRHHKKRKKEKRPKRSDESYESEGKFFSDLNSLSLARWPRPKVKLTVLRVCHIHTALLVFSLS